MKIEDEDEDYFGKKILLIGEVLEGMEYEDVALLICELQATITLLSFIENGVPVTKEKIQEQLTAFAQITAHRIIQLKDHPKYR